MPAFYISHFDVQADETLSAEGYTADLAAEYWVYKMVNFNSGGIIKNESELSDMFKNSRLFDQNSVYHNGGVSSAAFESAIPSNLIQGSVTFKDMGILNKDTNALYAAPLFSSASIAAATEVAVGSAGSTGFAPKVEYQLTLKGNESLIAEKMITSCNADFNVYDNAVPYNKAFGYKVTRNLDLPGSSKDRELTIGVLLIQESSTPNPVWAV